MTKKYKWERAKRGKDYIPPLLTNRDEFVPETHIGMYALMTDPKNEKLCMSDSACREIRLKAFTDVYNLYQEYGSPDYADLWNINREEINALGMNAFAAHTALAPIAELIECFERKYRLKSNGRLRYAISFGISKNLLNQYKANYAYAKRTGAEVKVPKLRRLSQRNKNIVIFGTDKIKLGKKTAEIPRDAVYQRFALWCKISCTDKQKAIETAINEFVENHPIEGIGEVSEYKVETAFDRYVYIQPGETKDIKVSVSLNGVIKALADKIIERYNLDPDNITKPYMDLDTYINNAVHLLNSKMDLKYRDPRLYEERMAVESLMRTNGVKEEDLNAE